MVQLTPSLARHCRKLAQQGTSCRRTNTPVMLVTGDSAPTLRGNGYYKPHSWRYDASTLRVEVGRRWLSRRATSIEREEADSASKARRDRAKSEREAFDIVRIPPGWRDVEQEASDASWDAAYERMGRLANAPI